MRLVDFADTFESLAAPAAEPIFLPYISTPATPAAGALKLYAKSDGKVYKRTPDGTEAEIGTGGGGGGGELVEDSSWASPTSLANSAEITAPSDTRSVRHVVGNGGARTGITIATGSDTQELWLVGTSDTNTVGMISSANVLLSGAITLRAGTVLMLKWTAGLNKWLETGRNEI